MFSMQISDSFPVPLHISASDKLEQTPDLLPFNYERHVQTPILTFHKIKTVRKISPTEYNYKPAVCDSGAIPIPAFCRAARISLTNASA